MDAQGPAQPSKDQNRNDNEQISGYFGGMIPRGAPISDAGSDLDKRLWAVSQFAGAVLERDNDVKLFRTTVLNRQAFSSRLNSSEWGERGSVELSPTGMVEWVRQRVRDEGVSTRVNVDVPSDIHISENTRREYMYLWLLNPDTDRRLTAWPVHIGGGMANLNQLRQLSLRLSHSRLGRALWRNDPSVSEAQRDIWNQARIATFVLTGFVPLLKEAQVPAPSGRGSRFQSAKHLQLGVFTAQNANTSLGARLESWNRGYPDWQYTQPTGFSSDSGLALRRLLRAIAQNSDLPVPPETESKLTVSEWMSRVYQSWAVPEIPEELRLHTEYMPPIEEKA